MEMRHANFEHVPLDISRCSTPSCTGMRYARSPTEEEQDEAVAALERGPAPERIEAAGATKE